MERTNDGTEKIIDFGKYKLQSDAREYVNCYLKYGAVCASLWTVDRILNRDRRRFRVLVKNEMRKRGLAQ